MMSFDARLAELNLQLPPVTKPKGLYEPLVQIGDLAYLSGHLPVQADGSLVTGRVGENMDVEAGHTAARYVALGLLATLRDKLGSLDRVRRVVRVVGMVNSTPEFTQQPAVINGCSELLAEVFGREAGVGARSAFGVAALPLGVPVEIEAIFQIQ